MTYEGWANYQTWNVALWISNDQILYAEARDYANSQDTHVPVTYREFVAEFMDGTVGDVTPDGVSWTDPTLDHEALDLFITELGGI